MFTLHLFFVTITFSINKNHRSEENDNRVKSIYDRAHQKALFNMSSFM